jgi:hypothetical protein
VATHVSVDGREQARLTARLEEHDIHAIERFW